jgi:formylglycine-generating enzyme required for sulfatase activity
MLFCCAFGLMLILAVTPVMIVGADAGSYAAPAVANHAATEKDSLSGGSYTEAETGMEFVLVKGGCYQMGDTFGDGYENEKPVHEVCLGDYYIGKFEVTQGQWKTVQGNNPSYFRNCGDTCPVENLSWDNAQAFIRILNRRTGKTYRLPTEAEWEYAARSGGKREKWAGTSNEAELGEYAWYSGNSGNRTHPVGRKKPNGIGIYDMSGNVWEWVQDIYSGTAYSSPVRNNPVYTGSGPGHVFRGGSWFYHPRGVRAAFRNHRAPFNIIRHHNVGLRLARTP